MKQRPEALRSPRHVAPTELLYRGVAEGQIVFDSERGIQRPSSAAFIDRRGPLSVDIASKTTPEESLQRLPRSIALASFSALLSIEMGYQVLEDPVFDRPGLKDNPAHALIASMDGDKPITKAHARILARKSCWAIPPNNIDCGVAGGT